MAKTKRRRNRRSRRNDPINQILLTAGRPEVLGVLLVLVSVFTLLSLITDSRGVITAWWIELLTRWVGMGVWGLPLVTGALGLWIVIRAIERMPDLPWQRPAGVALLLAAYTVGATLLLDGGSRAAGGYVGQFLAENLESGLGLWGAWAAVTIVVIIGVVMLTDRLLLDISQEAALTLQDFWQGRRGPANMPKLQPSLPMPSGEVPWWKRLRERLFPNRAQTPPPAPNLVSPKPNASQPKSEPAPKPKSQPAAAAHSQGASERPRTEPITGQPMTGQEDILSPHIVGAQQEWRLPEVGEILNDWERQVDSDDLIRKQGRLIQETLSLFGVPADFEGAYKGPSVTQYLIKPGYIERTTRSETHRTKVKVSKIAGLANDLALALAAPSVRIEAPIPGTSYVGIEVPNQEANVVGTKELMESEAFQEIREKAKLPIALGEDVKGQPIVADLARMPHLLIAGATGAGKSVCINAIITSLLLTKTPDELRFLMVDPKMVELSVYNGVPHLLSPVVTDVDRAAGVLFWAVKEMERRYQLCSKANARDLDRYNVYLRKRGEKPLPYIVIVVDEMADLMMAAPEEVEKHICRLAQMARAVGIHLIVATQRPSVDVITGLIKANFPARIAFAVSSQTDSRVILDTPGAERLLGRGDMLFVSSEAGKLARIQGTFLSDEEISRIVHYWKGFRTIESGATQANPEPAEEDPNTPSTETLPASEPAAPDRRVSDETTSLVPSPVDIEGDAEEDTNQPSLFAQIDEMKAKDSRDALFEDAIRIVKEAGRGSTSLLQRRLRVGYSRASRLVDQLEASGILGPDLGGNQGRALLIPSQAEEEQQPSPPPHIIGSRHTGHNPSDDAQETANPHSHRAESHRQSSSNTHTSPRHHQAGSEKHYQRQDSDDDPRPRVWM